MLLHIAALLAVAASPVPSASPYAPASTALPAPPARAPSPSPTPSDPCGSLSSIVSRPSVTTSVCTVRPGHVLVENGYQNTVTTGRAGSASAAYPQSLVRIGTFDPHLDFELAPPSVTTSSAGGTTIAGASDIGIGAKYELGYTAKASWGVSGVVTIPTGTPAFSAGAAQYTGDFNWGYTLSPAVGLTGTVSFNALSARDAAGQAQPYFALIPSIVVTTTLPVPGYGYAEYVYYSHAGPVAGAKSLIDFGYEVDVGNNVQLDLEYGVSPTSIGGQTQHYTGAGLSFMY